MTLIQWLIASADSDAYRAGRAEGIRHPKADSKMIRAMGGLRSLVNQARELENEGLIRVDWTDLGADIRQIHYSLDIIPELCAREGIEDPRQRQLRYICKVRKWLDDMKDTWLLPYYEEIFNRLGDGKHVKIPDLEDEDFFRCLNTIPRMEEPAWRRVFSAAVFGSSKAFETKGSKGTKGTKERKGYQTRVLTVLKSYSPFYVEGMSDEDILMMHRILTYSQTMEWKGPLRYAVDQSVEMDSSQAYYGTVINSRTLEHAKPLSMPGVKRVIVIENKANYEAMEYRADTLYLYCHGFYSPKERAFLKGLSDVSKEDVEYLHWGDMDLGGIRIFQFNRQNLFLGLKPYRMDKETYTQALESGAGIPLDGKKREALEKLDAGLLEELKESILTSGMEIEQEMLLAHKLKDIVYKDV